MSHLTTHVLDTTHGRPAAGIAVTLVDADGVLVASGTTDPDGRIAALGPDRLPPGGVDADVRHRRVLGRTRPAGVPPPAWSSCSRCRTTPGTCTSPLLLSPFAHSTYQGS
ncbi:hydroxyisourate hydrolase [Curtobacterium sp. MCJR17_043]|uniref:hydroxyisourate hydrolase n=1 Tax=Curtobacterium sp. MCJR17_043 TaxID=2175660 RepID=UPI0032E90248